MGTEKSQESNTPGHIGLWVIIFLIFAYVFGSGNSATNDKRETTIAPAPKRGHVTPMIKDGINSAWVYYESKVYRSKAEINPIGYIVKKASVLVMPEDYDWVKIFEAPARCNDGSRFLDNKELRGSYMKRFNLSTVSPGEWPENN